MPREQFKAMSQCKWRNLVAKFATIVSHVVAKFNPSYGVNFWVRCASGNVFLFSPIHGDVLGYKLKSSWSDLSLLSASDIYFVLSSAIDILGYILSCRAVWIYDLPINL